MREIMGSGGVRQAMRMLIPAAALLGLVSCVAPPPPPSAPPQPRPVPPPVVTQPLSDDWRDWPVTPGDWRSVPGGAGSAAEFGARGAAPALVVRCDPAARAVLVERTGPSTSPQPLIDITTSAGRTTYRGTSLSSRQATVASIAARDPFLDKMAFSRGRFIVAVSGTERLVIPTWPEFARVVEDCRG